MSDQKNAKLRCCASCEWIFKGGVECPKCGFGSYGARRVCGDAAYRLKRSQKRWFDKQMAKRASELEAEIREAAKVDRLAESLKKVAACLIP